MKRAITLAGLGIFTFFCLAAYAEEVVIPEKATANEYFALLDTLQRSLPETETVDELREVAMPELRQIKQLSDLLLECEDATDEQFARAAHIRIMSILHEAKADGEDVMEKIVAFQEAVREAGREEVAEGIQEELPRMKLVIAGLRGKDVFLPIIETHAKTILADGAELNLELYSQALTACHLAEIIFGKKDIATSILTNKCYEDAYRKAGHTGVADVFLSHQRRLGLVGNEMKLTGKTLDGKDFDLASLKGKTIFLYFSPDDTMVEEEGLMKLQKLEEVAGPKGLQVVGVVLSDNLVGLRKVAADFKVPWPLLQNKNTAVEGQDVVSYYGIRMFPCVFIISKEGKVLSTNAKPAEIRRLLAEELE